MQYAISPHVTEALYDWVEKLHCKLLQKVVSIYVLEPQRISDVHEEGDLIVAPMCISSFKGEVRFVSEMQASIARTRPTSRSTDDTHTSAAIKLHMQACSTGSTSRTLKLGCYRRIECRLS